MCSGKGHVTGGNIMNFSLHDFPLLGRNILLSSLILTLLFVQATSRNLGFSCAGQVRVIIFFQPVYLSMKEVETKNNKEVSSALVVWISCCAAVRKPRLGAWLNPFTAVGAHRALIDLTLSDARRFYLSMGHPLAAKGLATSKTLSPLRVISVIHRFQQKSIHLDLI